MILMTLTPDQIPWVLFFLGLLIGLPISYVVNLANKMDTVKKEKKDTRNAIKNSIEIQDILPLIIRVFTTLSSKIDFKNVGNFEEEVESLIYKKENWVRLDSDLRTLEEKISELAKVDRIFDNYIRYTSYFSKILFSFIIVISAIVPVYLFGDLVAWVIWVLALIQVSMCLILVQLKSCNASKEFDKYEDSYIR